MRNWFEIQKRQQLCLTSVERQLRWVLGVTLSSDTVSWLKWPLVSWYFRKGFLKFWASELQGEKPLASSIDQSFGLQPCNESLEAWERGMERLWRASTTAVAPAHRPVHRVVTADEASWGCGFPCIFLAAACSGLVKLSCQMSGQM